MGCLDTVVRSIHVLKVRYILRLAMKCNQNDTYVKDQAVDAVQA